jgi:hypothetical protein
MYILPLQEQKRTKRHFTWNPILKAQQSMPAFVKAVMKFLVPHKIGNFTDWMTFSFLIRAVLHVCQFGLLTNSTLSGYQGPFPCGVKHPEPEAGHAFQAWGEMTRAWGCTCYLTHLPLPPPPMVWCSSRIKILSFNLFINASANFTSDKFWRSTLRKQACKVLLRIGLCKQFKAVIKENWQRRRRRCSKRLDASSNGVPHRMSFT